MSGILIGLISIVFATWLIWQASDRLEQTAHHLAVHYGLPEVVKGSVIMAISSSFPELATIVLAGAIHGNFELGIATIIGSAIFNILVIPGASVLAAKDTFNTDHNIVFREGQFYLISILVTGLMICFAVIYYPVDNTPLQGYLSWQIAALPLIFYALYAFFQLQEVNGNKSGKTDEQPSKPVWQLWLVLIASMIFITIGVEILLKVVIDAETLFHVPSYVWGATIIAVVTSLPDLFMSVKAAQHNSADSSMGNAIGSNIFDLLVIIPLGVLAVGSVLVDLSILMPLMGFLLLSTIVTVIAMRQGFKLSKTNAWLFIAIYLTFTLWAFVH